jgi:hypothetical protein
MKLFTKKSYIEDRYGDYYTEFSDEFKKLIESAKEKLFPFAEKTLNDTSGITIYFTIDDDEYSEYDCCDNDECEQAALNQIKEDHPNGWVEVYCVSNNSDYDSIRKCTYCGRLLSDYLTWVKFELQDIEECDEYNKEYFKSHTGDAVSIYIILDSIPSVDVQFTAYQRLHGLNEEFFAEREAFYRRIYKLVTKINKAI